MHIFMNVIDPFCGIMLTLFITQANQGLGLCGNSFDTGCICQALLPSLDDLQVLAD